MCLCSGFSLLSVFHGRTAIPPFVYRFPGGLRVFIAGSHPWTKAISESRNKKGASPGMQKIQALALGPPNHESLVFPSSKLVFLFYFEHLEWFWGPLVQSDQETKHRLYERVGKAILHSRMGAAFGTGALPNPPVRLRRSRSPQVELNTASNLCALNRAILFVNADDVRFSASGSEGVPAGKFLW